LQEIREKAEKDKELGRLFKEIQNYLNRDINGREMGILDDLYEMYHFDVPTILITAEYCNTLGKYSVPYLHKLLKDWYEHDITTYEQAEAEIVRRTEYNSYESMVKRCLGLTNNLTTHQKEYVDRWRSAGIDESLLEIACEKCLDGTGGKINFKYIDTVISSWVNKGIKTPEQVKADDASFSSKNGKFVADDKENSYTIDKLEKLANNFISRNEDTSQ
jgi:DnaD/phage-associated family protein